MISLERWARSAVVLLLLSCTCFAQTAGARFLLWKPSAASMALGGTGVARGNNTFNAYYNPALLCDIPSFNAVGSFVKPLPFFNNVAHSFAGVSFILNDEHYISLTNNMFWKAPQAYTQLYSGAMLPDRDGEDDYFFSFLPKVSYARFLTSRISIGAGLGMLFYDLTGAEFGAETKVETIKRLTFDIGISARNYFRGLTLHLDDATFVPLRAFAPISDLDGIHFGLSLLNLGADIQAVDKSQSDPMPATVLAGMSWVFLTSNYLSVIINAELEKQIHEDSFIQLLRSGAELRLLNVLSFQGGHVRAINDAYNSFLTYGFGVHTRYLSFHLSRYNATFIPTWHFDGAIYLEF